MPANFNRAIIAGNLTRDPQVRSLANDQAVCNFGLAVNRRYSTSEGDRREETTFVDVECWGRIAELVGQYLTKGRQALVEGRLKMDAWEDKDGNKRTKLLVVAASVQFLDGRDDSSGSRECDTQPAPSAPPAPPVGGSDDPPF